MRSTTVFVNDENMALIHCPHCNSIKQAPVLKYKGEKHTLKVKCACGDVFQVNLNFRKNKRKKMDLPGTCYKASGHPSLAVECKIKNLSFRGLGIELFAEGNILKGDAIVVSFTLDDVKKTPVTRKMIVHHVEKKYIGGEFVDTEGDNLDKQIGFYLMP